MSRSSSVAGISEIYAVVVGIASSTETQSSGLGRINSNVSDIDRGVRESADLFKSSAEATRKLTEQTEELQRRIGFFQLGEGPLGQGSTTPARLRRSA